jgi:hypothetical protein
MRGVIVLLWLIVRLVPPLGVAAPAETGLRVWVRDLEDRGVASVHLTLIDAQQQARAVLTDAQGVALLAPLPGTFVRLIRASDPQGQALLMDENDRAGGLRLPLQAGRVQALNLRLSDGLLFVEPVAEAVDPAAVPAAAAEPASSHLTATAAPSTATGADALPAPDALVRPSDWQWLRWLVLGVLGLIGASTATVQVRAILRARRAP